MVETKIDGKGAESFETKVEIKNSKCPSLRHIYSALTSKIEGARGFYKGVKKDVSKINCKNKCRKIFTVQTIKNKLPFLKWAPLYKLEDLRGDLIAGFTLGLTVIPQSLAYARIAELPTQYGLYTSFVCYFVYAFMGTAKDVNIGPAAVMSLLTAEFTHQIPQLAAVLSLICGVAQLLMGLLNIGFVMEFISHTIINSFTTAAAHAILFSQVKRWLGLHGVPRDFMRQLYYSIVKIPETNLADCIMGTICMIILYLLKKLKTLKLAKESSPFVIESIQFISTARNAITIFLASIVAVTFHQHDLHLVTLTGNITSGVPEIKVPSLTVQLRENYTIPSSETFKMIGIGSVITPLVGLIEVIAIAKAFGKKNGYKVDSTQEFISLGVSNVLGAFVQAYPVTGSFSRSAVAAQSGIRTPAANIVTGILVLLALAFLTPLFYFIPTPGLAAVIIMAVTDLIDFSMLIKMWKINKPDLVPWFATFFTSLLFGFEYGILLGVAVSLLFLIYPWTKSTVKIKPLDDSFEEIDNFQTIKTEKSPKLIVVQPTFGMLFPGAEVFEEKIYKHVSNKDYIILDFNHIWNLDFSATMALCHLAKDFESKKIKYIFINLHPGVEKKLVKIKTKNLRTATSIQEAIAMLKCKENCEEDTNLIKESGSNILKLSVECEVENKENKKTAFEHEVDATNLATKETNVQNSTNPAIVLEIENQRKQKEIQDEQNPLLNK